jgi:hypothetical protein
MSSVITYYSWTKCCINSQLISSFLLLLYEYSVDLFRILSFIVWRKNFKIIRVKYNVHCLHVLLHLVTVANTYKHNTPSSE